MEKIKSGKYVELAYDLYEVSPKGGQILVHQTATDDPERIIYGVTPGVIRPLEAAIEGLSTGDSFDVTVKAEEAFGPYDPEQVAHLEKDIFEVDGKFDDEMIKKGALVPMMTAEGYRINGLVIDVTDSEVVMDFNHPLAGKEVRFKGKIGAVREATPEELKPAQGCGCGCQGGCSDGSCCDGEKDCGQGCH